MSKPHPLLAGGGSTAAVALLDYATGWEALPNPIYFVPIVFFAWRGTRRTALILAVLASGAFAIVQLLTKHSHGRPAHAGTLGIELASCVGVALVSTGVRQLILARRRRTAEFPVEENAARACAQMRSITSSGKPRDRGNLDLP
jgi:hypothetical protein